LTWDRYDGLLQAKIDDFSILAEVNEEVGGPRFAIISIGDGAFRLEAKKLVAVA
jgi:hypothetical protein